MIADGDGRTDVMPPIASLPALLDRFSSLRVLVIGEAMVDSYLRGAASRLSREAPAPIVALHERDHAPGGAANAAANLASLGADVALLSVVGQDDAAELLVDRLEGVRVNVDGVIAAETRQTVTKNRVVADGQLLVRFDEGSTEPIELADQHELGQRLRSVWDDFDAILASDYGYGVLTARLRNDIATLQARSPRVLVADARDLRGYRGARLTAAKPNYAEAVGLLGEPSLEGGRHRLQQMAANGDRLLELTGAGIVALTLDSEGALVFEAGAQPFRTYARPTGNARAAGAGDTFSAALTLALAAGGSTTSAAEIASLAASIVVTKEGTALCSCDELRASLHLEDKYLDGKERLARAIAFHRRQGRRIVFTNGCFDIIHRGHITYLNRAKALGDVLIVGVNTDESVHRLKGSARPINSLEDRVEVLAALSCIDHIVAFAEDTPDQLIRSVRPDVFVKGGDYSYDRLPEASLVESLGGSVQILPYVEDRSTSGLIERIRATEAGTPREPAGVRS